MNTNGHYTVSYHEWPSPLKDQVKALTCKHCSFYVVPRTLHRAGDRSGQGRYNRARGVMVRHLHKEHGQTLIAVAGALMAGARGSEHDAP